MIGQLNGRSLLVMKGLRFNLLSSSLKSVSIEHILAGLYQCFKFGKALRVLNATIIKIGKTQFKVVCVRNKIGSFS